MYKKILVVLYILLLAATSIHAQPAAPVNLEAELSEHFFGVFVDLNWEKPVEYFTRYNVYKKPSTEADSTEYTLVARRILHTDFKDRRVQAGETYSYYVTSVTRDGESDASNIVSITVTEPTPPEYGVVSGTVTSDDDGSPLGRTLVKFIPAEGYRCKFAYTDSLGFYSTELQTGDYYIYFMARGYWYEFHANTRYFDEATPVTVSTDDSLTVDAGLETWAPPANYILSGNVTDEEGNGLNAGVYIYKMRYNSYHYHHRYARTDNLGNYSVNVMEGDSLIVFAKPFNHHYLPEFYDNQATFADANRIYVEGNVTDINFVLDTVASYQNSVAGMVKDSTDTGIEAYIKAINLEYAAGYPKHYRTITDSLGAYAFENLYPGNYIFFAKPFGEYLPTFFRYDGVQAMHWNEADTVTVAETSTLTEMDFYVNGREFNGEAKITGTANDNSGSPLKGVYVYVFNEELNSGTFAITDDEGNYSVEGLVPGNYTVFGDMIDYETEVYTSVGIDYSSNVNHEVDITLTPNSITATESENDFVADAYELAQNYPNPFNPSTVISYSIPEATVVKLSVYNTLGEEISTLVNTLQDAGTYSVQFDASKLATGIYLYTLETGKFTVTKKMLLLK